jgi:hypothetical protein
MKQVVYKGLILAKGSTALELWEAWQKDTKDRNAAQKKLDVHMKDVETRSVQLSGVPHSKNGWCIGETVSDEEFLQWYHVDGPAVAKLFGVEFTPIGMQPRRKELLDQGK